MENNWMENILNDDILKDYLTFTSLYIALYENFVDYVESNIKSFLCLEEIEDGKLVYKITPKYRDEIKNRVVDEKNNKNITKASFLWLVDQGALTQSEYVRFLEIKEVRNSYAHDLTNYIINGIDTSHISLMLDMIAMYKKVSKWWFINIDAEIMGYEIDESADIKSLANLTFDIILNVLYNGKSKEYQQILKEALSKNPQ